MKKVFIGLLWCMCSLASYAQKRQLELSLYGGSQSYTKLESPYKNGFSSGFGFGFQAKYFVANRVYWVGDLYGATDDGTEYKVSSNGVDRLASSDRRDYTLATGFGFNFLSTRSVQSYLQVLAGFGHVEGYTSDFVSEAEGVKRFDFKKSSYLLSAGVGIDFSLSESWKVGGMYSFRYIGDFDGGHSIAAKISYVIP